MSSATDTPPLPLDRPTPVADNFFRQIYGGGLICCMLMLVLYGLSVLQTYLYYLSYPNDRRVIKMLVAVLFFVSTLHAIFLCHNVYYYVIFTYHDPFLLLHGEWSLFMANATGVLICLLVQLFYTRMIYHLTKNKWRWLLTTVLVLLTLMQVAFGIATVIGEFREGDISKLATIAVSSMVPTCAARVASDSVTALALCILLHGAQSGIGGSGEMVHTLIIYAIDRFLLTTVIVLVQMIALICSPDSIWAMMIDFISVHLYVNSCLATLNSRNHLRNISRSDAEDAARFITTGDGIRFESSHQQVRGRRSSIAISPGIMRTSDFVRTDVDVSIKDKRPGDDALTTAISDPHVFVA